MITNCKKCRTEIILNNQKIDIEGVLITCDNCKEEWIYHSRSYFLESRLAELDRELDTKVSSINKQNKIHSDKILTLKKDLENKKNELNKQTELEKKVSNFETRITVTEKLNSDQAHLESEIFQLEKDLIKTAEDIASKNLSIEKKANYLEMKIGADEENSSNEKKIGAHEEKSSNEKKIGVNDNNSGVVDFVKYDDKQNKQVKKKSFWLQK